MARRFTVRGAEELGRKAQGVHFETMFEEEGFAYELYPPKQVQRRNLDGLMVVSPGGYRLFASSTPADAE